MSAPTLQDRFRGALLGTAVGDALGAPFEGWDHIHPDALERVGRSVDPLRWTDDTHMTLSTAESLIAAGGFDGADMADRFVRAFEQEPWRGYGAGPPRIFAAIRAGAPWDQPAKEAFGGTGSFGNGAAMRIAPAGLLRYGDLRSAVDLARQCAAITHTHEIGLQGAALQAAAVAWLVSAQPTTGWTRGPTLGQSSPGLSLIGDLGRFATAPTFELKLRSIAEAASDTTPQQAAMLLGNGIAADDAVPAALWAFLRHPRSYPDAIRAAILMGGDTDTIAAMTGALSGTFLGADAIPVSWVQRVEQAERIIHLADRLHDAAVRPSTI
jgi:poly(ADP-ribose) glycohydrolase ARH3